MARTQDRNKAIRLRLQGMSFSQIKEIVGVGKGTLSVWLRNYPLTPEQIETLKQNGLKPSVEKIRATKLKKKNLRLEHIFQAASKNIGVLTMREVFIAGLFLYWAEGTKSSTSCVAFSNTDPGMIRFFMRWLSILKVPKEKIRIKLHIYSDMNEPDIKVYWSSKAGLPLTAFRKTYVKSSKLAGITYGNGHGKGTCTIIYSNTRLLEYILASIKFLRGNENE